MWEGITVVDEEGDEAEEREFVSEWKFQECVGICYFLHQILINNRLS